MANMGLTGLDAERDLSPDAKAPTPPLAWVENGEVRVAHQPGGPFPVLVPGSGVELVVNGVLCPGPTPVREGDRIELRPLVAERAGSWRLEVAPGGLEARLHVRPRVVSLREIPDLPPATQLEVVPRTREVKSPPLTLEELFEEFERRGICHGVDRQACERAVHSEEEGTFVVARATPPVPGEPARLNIFFPQVEKVPVVADPEEKVDFRWRFLFTSVAPGTLLARKIPPRSGRPGCNIFGAVLAPPAPDDFVLVAGPGVAISADGLEAVACQAGRPYVQKQRRAVRIGVMPTLEHLGDVDIGCGNIFFQGDVRIQGNVQEGMKVKATGRVEVSGHVSSATVETGGSAVVAGNVLSSVVVAGGHITLFREVRLLLENLHREVTDLVAAIEQLLASPILRTVNLEAGIGPLVLLLLDGKFKNIPSVVKSLGKSVKMLPREMVSEDLVALCRDIENRFLVAPLHFKEVKVLREILAKIERFLSETNQHVSENADLVLRYALSSTLVAAGAVKILGAGCYSSTVRAGKTVFIRGVCRGGEIKAGGDVVIGELGSPAGIKTTVCVPAGARVRVGLARENAVVQIGNYVHHFDREEREVELRLDKEGNLKLRRSWASQ